MLLEEAYRIVCEAPVEDVTKMSQRTGRPINRKHYDTGVSNHRDSKMNTAMFENPKYVNYLKQNLF